VLQPKVKKVYIHFYLIIAPVPVVLAVVKKKIKKITDILFHEPNELQSVFDFRLN
jgi:hypothetical protein